MMLTTLESAPVQIPAVSGDRGHLGTGSSLLAAADPHVPIFRCPSARIGPASRMRVRDRLARPSPLSERHAGRLFHNRRPSHPPHPLPPCRLGHSPSPGNSPHAPGRSLKNSARPAPRRRQKSGRRRAAPRSRSGRRKSSGPISRHVPSALRSFRTCRNGSLCAQQLRDHGLSVEVDVGWVGLSRETSQPSLSLS